MTGRARWIAFLAFAGLVTGIVRAQPNLTLFAASVYVWILVQWVIFEVIVGWQNRHMVFRRSVNDRTQDVDTLWQGRSAAVQLTMESKGIFTDLYIRDVLPEITELSSTPVKPLPALSADSDQKTSSLFGRFTKPRFTRQMQLQPNELQIDSYTRGCALRYYLRPRAAGKAVLPGVRLTFQDKLGFFRKQRLFPLPQTLRILPTYAQGADRSSAIKRHNALPRHGIHRMQRSGVGSELLELREYIPGDPPKSIAWKVSARREQLMTRTYESEVPIRVHLFVDGSISTRIGGFGRRLIDQINYVAASVAKAAIAVGDPVTCTLMDENRSRKLGWHTGDRGFLQLLRSLAEYSDAEPPEAIPLTRALVDRAYSVLREHFPDLFDVRYYSSPFYFFRNNRRRRKLVAFCGVLNQLTARQEYECLFDDQLLAIQLRRLLHNAGQAWLPPLYTQDLEKSGESAKNMLLVSESLNRAIAHARDNEMFVILADVMNSAPHLSAAVRSIKLAIAKHHRVCFVCPSTTFERPSLDAIIPDSTRVSDLLLAAEQTRCREFAQQLNRDLTRIGATVSFSGEHDAIQTVMSEIEAIRHGGMRGGHAARRHA